VPDRPPTGARRGWFSIGVHRPKTMENVGMLWRHARLYDAAWLFTVGHRYRKVATDVPNAARHMPLFHYDGLFDLAGHVPSNAQLVCVELTDGAVPLPDFVHPGRAVYLLGAEDEGLPGELLDGKWPVVSIPSCLPQSMNVAAAGTLVMYDRHVKTLDRRAQAERERRVRVKNIPTRLASVGS
jgi:tRNA(Leu) C34 or U34 (ribose-2'-O)-methylase TrmL